jgi:hypothetical protein
MFGHIPSAATPCAVLVIAEVINDTPGWCSETRIPTINKKILVFIILNKYLICLEIFFHTIFYFVSYFFQALDILTKKSSKITVPFESHAVLRIQIKIFYYKPSMSSKPSRF